MSAIWGAVDLDNAEINSDIAASMQKALKKYRIDRYAFEHEKNAVMGCGIQYTRKSSVKERLPFSDDGLLFTADGMLDNRLEVAEKLGISPLPPDGELFYLAFKKWGVEVNEHLRGAYSFAAYDKANNKLLLSVDHVSNRVLYYCKEGSTVYFGTSLDSIVNALPNEHGVSEVWITEFLSTKFISNLQETCTTPYAGIRLLPPASLLVFSADVVESRTFWQPHFTASDKRPDAEVFAELRNIFDKSVAEVTDDVEKTAILLSSGMDSTTVGAAAAFHLKKHKKKLYSYTSVPTPQYKGKNNHLFAVDESGLVKQLCEMHKNIEPTFFSGEGNNSLTFIDDSLHHLENPFKSAINLTWLYPLNKQIGEEGCTVLLNGSAGNITISFGTVLHYATTLMYARKRPLKAICALLRQAKRYNYSRKLSVKSWLESTFPRYAGKSIKRIKNAENYNVIASKELFQKHDISNKLIQKELYAGARNTFEYNRQRRTMMSADSLLSKGVYETKMSLMSGAFSRDITRDKRICELCFSQPLERFAKFEKGTKEFATRRMIAGAFSDILPKKLAENVMTFGVQSADWTFRLRENYSDVVKTFEETFFDERIAHYLNKEHISELIALSKTDDAEGNAALMELVCNFSAAKFLINHCE